MPLKPSRDNSGAPSSEASSAAVETTKSKKDKGPGDIIIEKPLEIWWARPPAQIASSSLPTHKQLHVRAFSAS